MDEGMMKPRASSQKQQKHRHVQEERYSRRDTIMELNKIKKEIDALMAKESTPAARSTSVPKSIVVEKKRKGKSASSSLNSVVSEITTPIVVGGSSILQQQALQPPVPALDHMMLNHSNNNGEIFELKLRLEAIKERRARINKKKHGEFPKDIQQHHSYRRRHYHNCHQDPPPTSIEEERDLDESLKEPSQIAAAVAAGFPSISMEDFHHRDEKKSPTTTTRRMLTVTRIVEEENEEEAEQTSPVPPSPPRPLERSLPVLSSKSTAVSTCRTIDETIDDTTTTTRAFHETTSAVSSPSSNYKSNHHQSWKNLRRLICKSSKDYNVDADTSFEQIRRAKTSSMDHHCPRNVTVVVEEDYDEEEEKEEDLIETLSEILICKGRPSITKRHSFQTFDQTQKKNDFLIGQEPLRGSKSKSRGKQQRSRRATDLNTFYQHNQLVGDTDNIVVVPGKAYSEIISENSQDHILVGKKHQTKSSSSCFRKDPWYVRPISSNDDDDDDDYGVEDGNRTMHAVVFVKQ
jgi:hypothetical protein